MSQDALIAFNRFGLGARAEGIGGLKADPRAALLAELDDPRAALLRRPALGTTPELLAEYQTFQRRRRAARQAGTAGMDEMRQGAPASVLRAELGAKLNKIGAAELGLVERLVGFWSNHFAIEADAAGPVRTLAGAFEREAIRPHVLGRFADLLGAATKHPAMLVYLNNARSVGPNSRAGHNREAGLNENHARELLELHTLGVDGGYSQADVTALAKVLTGWGYGAGRERARRQGRFFFRAQAHEPGPQTVLGVAYAQEGVEQGEAVLAALAHSPMTARHIATKLATHFVADTPPPELVAALAQVFVQTDGDLGAVSRALVAHPLAWSTPLGKFRTPQDFVWAAIRALDFKAKPQLVSRALQTLGQPIWNPPAPNGFADTAATWLAPDAMTTRVEVADLLAQEAQVDDPRRLAEALFGPALAPATRQAIERAESPAQGLVLLLMSPQFLRR